MLFNKFMMVNHNNYLTLSNEDKDKYKIKNMEKLTKNFATFLNKEIFGFYNVDFNSEDIDEEKVLLRNYELCRMQGIGENSFYIDEFDYNYECKNIYEYFKFKFDSSQEDGFIKKEKKFVFNLRETWARIIFKNKEFSYLTLISVNNYVFNEVKRFIIEYSKNLIPYEMNMVEISALTYSLSKSANGQESRSDELEKRIYDYLKKENQKLMLKLIGEDPTIRVIDNSSKNCPDKIYIFSNEVAAKNVRLENFENDSEKLLTSSQNILDLIEKEKEKAKKYVDLAYEDIISNIKKDKFLKLIK